MGYHVPGRFARLFRNPWPTRMYLACRRALPLEQRFRLCAGLALFRNVCSPGISIIGAFGTIFLVYWLGRSEGKTITETVLLAGIAVGFFLQAIVSFLKVVASDEALRSVVLWMMDRFPRQHGMM